MQGFVHIEQNLAFFGCAPLPHTTPPLFFAHTDTTHRFLLIVSNLTEAPRWFNPMAHTDSTRRLFVKICGRKNTYFIH